MALSDEWWEHHSRLKGGQRARNTRLIVQRRSRLRKVRSDRPVGQYVSSTYSTHRAWEEQWRSPNQAAVDARGEVWAHPNV
jgi:hypothetical protein